MVEEIGDEQRKLLSTLDESGVWYNVSINDPVWSCQDAANRRWRLGHEGIPLADELKSHVAGYLDDAGRERFVVVHCRGNERRDDEKVSALVGGEVYKLGKERLGDVFGSGYGLVNPMLFVSHPEVRQVFDSSVLERYFAPHTMMTNLGTPTLAIEFRPADLIRALPNAEVADVITRDTRVPKELVFGILTGNSPESGIELWKHVNRRIREQSGKSFSGDCGLPRILVESVPDMGLSMELPSRLGEVREVVLGGARQLCLRGATVLGVACNTSQYFSEELRKLCSEYQCRFVSMVDETERRLAEEGISRFDLLGIGAVTALGQWSDFGRIADRFEIHVPKPGDEAAINDLAFSIKKEGASDRNIQRLRALIARTSSTETVLLALTELSVAFAAQKESQKGSRSGKKYVDTLTVLGDAMADLYLRELAIVQVPPGDEDEDG